MWQIGCHLRQIEATLSRSVVVHHVCGSISNWVSFPLPPYAGAPLLSVLYILEHQGGSQCFSETAHALDQDVASPPPNPQPP